MLTFDLKPTHRTLQNYYRHLQEAQGLNDTITHLFANLLRYCARQIGLQLLEQEYICRNQGGLRVDGILVDDLQLRHGIWETIDSLHKETMQREIQRRFQQGCPNDNVLFQSPDRLIIYQGRSKPLFDKSIKDSPDNLLQGLRLFLEYQKPAVKEWHLTASEFQGKIAKLGHELVNLIRQEHKTNQNFRRAFNRFARLCQRSLNPTLADAVVEEILIQHLLIEKLFSKVFKNPEFVNKNAVAQEIEKVLSHLTFKAVGRKEFFKPYQLDKFYTALAQAANTIGDHTDRQPFIKAVNERFFQGFAVKATNTSGMVYTHHQIIEFIVKAVNSLLQQKFGCSLADNGVHLIDPFAGAGHFMVRVLQEIHATKPARLKHKYLHELHCNEVTLPLHYLASLNIEHEYYQKVGKFQSFAGISLGDIFELIDSKPLEWSVARNTRRTLRHESSPETLPTEDSAILVIVGNPPYNVGQQNDDHRNRKYLKLDKLVADTYAKDSKATSVSKLNNPYVKVFRWASWQIRGHRGIVVLVSNSGYLENLAFDGMRKHLADDFDQIYCLDLGGNIRKAPGAQNVFDIRVGVCITLLVRNPGSEKGIFYAKVDDSLKKQEKLAELTRHPFTKIHWQRLSPDENHTWMTMELQPEFAKFIPLGTKAIKASKTIHTGTLFKNFSLGVNSNRDSWAFHFSRPALVDNIKRFITCYNGEVDRWLNRKEEPTYLDDFILQDESRIKWSSRLREYLLRGHKTRFNATKIRLAMYRPFTVRFLYFEEVVIHRLGRLPRFFPTPATEAENQVICVSTAGTTKAFHCLMAKMLPDLHFTGDSQCFPFYTYDEDGSNRQENITDWALSHFQTYYSDPSISKWDIFYYVYGFLHHPQYRERYAANLRRELSRLPPPEELMAFNPWGRNKEVFWVFSQVGKRLANLHLYYERQPQYPLLKMATPDLKLSYRVEKMRLTKAKDCLIYNDTLTLKGIPPVTFEYRLGNRSALEWVIDQYQVTINGHRGNSKKLEWLNDYQVKTPRGSGIVNDPNRSSDEGYILRLIGQVVWVSVETMKLVKALPQWPAEGN